MKLEFDDHVLEVPSSWNDIKLRDYERWFMFEPKDQMEYVQFVASVCGTQADVLLNAPTQVFNTLVEAISFISHQDFEPKNHIEMDGEKYFVSFSDDLTLAEWVDVESTLDSESESKISEVLAILCRPVGEKYNTKTADTRKEVFRNLPCDKVLPLIAFFLYKKRQSEKILNLYSMAKDRTDQLQKAISHFVENGDGIKSLPIWRRIRYYFLIRSLKKQLSKYSDFFSTEPTKPLPKKNKRSLFNK